MIDRRFAIFTAAFGCVLGLSLGVAPVPAAARCMLPPQVRVRQILTSDRAKALAARAELEHGADFMQTLQKYALLPKLGLHGRGEVGWIWLDQLQPQVAEQLAQLPVGGVTDPIQEIGWAVMQVEARRPAMTCRARIAQEPNDPRPRYELGLAALQRNDNTSALTDLNGALRVAPTYEPALLARGVVDIRGKHRTRARADLDAAIAQNPNDPNAYLARGYLETLTGDDDLATTDEDRALSLDPNNAAALLYRSNAYFDLGYLDASYADLAIPLRDSTTAPRAQLQRGMIAFARGDDATALAAFARSAHNPPLANISFLDAGIVRVTQGNLAAALGDMQRAARADPADPYAAIWLAYVRRSLGQPDTLANDAHALDEQHWPGPIVRLFLGDESARNVASAAASGDAYAARVERCENVFYAALYQKMHQHKARARAGFRVAASSCPYRETERWAAHALLTLPPH